MRSNSSSSSSSDFSENLDFWLVGDETNALDLAQVVESEDTDVSLGVLLYALVKLLQHL